jgi:hypothetical protein
MDSIADLLCPVLTLLTLGYAAICAVSPFGTCRRCSGLGFTGTPQGRRSRPCRHCDATGIRIRFGRRLYHRAVDYTRS